MIFFDDVKVIYAQGQKYRSSVSKSLKSANGEKPLSNLSPDSIGSSTRERPDHWRFRSA